MNSNVVQSGAFGYQNKVILNGNQEQIPMADPKNLLSNLRAEETASRGNFNVLNAQMRSSLNSKYVRVPQNYQPQPGFPQSYPSVQNYVYQNMAPLYGQYRGFN